MKLLKVDTVYEARARIYEYCSVGLMRTEKAALNSAYGRILAEDICSDENIPPYRRSIMDGYAVISSDLGAAGEMTPALLRITGEVLLGEDCSMLRVEPGCCIYVPTGGTVPDGADAVVMAEYCEPFGDDSIAASESVAAGENVVQIGEDIAKGDIILKKGTKIRAQDIGVLAAAGITEISVCKPWNVTVISTGDELVSPDQPPGPGQMRDINSYTIAARTEAEGMNVVRTVAVKDERDLLGKVLEKAKSDSDIVIVSGGSSQGKKDASAEMIGNAADSGVLTHGIAVKPGKPTITGYDKATETLFISLPGHPAAALMIYEEIVIRLWRELTGQKEERAVRAKAAANIPAAPGRKTMQLVRLEEEPCGDESGCLFAWPVIAKSGMISAMSVSDGYFEMSENQEGVRAGDSVLVHLWK